MASFLRRTYVWTAVALLPALGSAGCFSSCENPAPTAESSAPAVESAPTDQVVASGLADAETQVARGEAIVQVDENGRATVIANQYPRLGLLGKLSRQAGFQQQRNRGDEKLSSDVTVSAANVPIEEAIAGILNGLDYQIYYSFDENANRARLAKVSIGSPREGKRRREHRIASLKNRYPSARDTRSGSEDLRDRAAALRDRQEREEERVRQIEEGLASGTDEVRVAAVDRMRPEGQELETLKQLLAGDPSPAVRASAASRLEGSDGGTAVGALITALKDPDPTVVKTAIEALEFAAEPDNIPAILETGVTQNPDPEIRGAALEAIEFIGD